MLEIVKKHAIAHMYKSSVFPYFCLIIHIKKTGKSNVILFKKRTLRFRKCTDVRGVSSRAKLNKSRVAWNLIFLIVHLRRSNLSMKVKR